MIMEDKIKRKLNYLKKMVKRTKEEENRIIAALIGGGILGAAVGGTAGAIIGALIGVIIAELENKEKRKI